MSELEVIAVGSKVLIDKEIPATVVAVCLSGVEHRLEYQCAWWDERNRKVEWLTPAEVVLQDGKSKTLRFVAA